MEFLDVDGSQGEGGGQTLRIAVSFAVVQRRPVRVNRIRAGREVPGLRRQHVSALKILAQVFGGELRGAEEGSSEVTYAPGEQKAQSLSVDTGTAASITLILQAAIPAAALGGKGLKLGLSGGTDVPWSPTIDYFGETARRAYGAIGVKFTLEVVRRGYYPRGGGQVAAVVEPSDGVKSVDWGKPAEVRTARVFSRCALLPLHVAERQSNAAEGVLRSAGIEPVPSPPTEERADSPGSSVFVKAEGDELHVGADAIGQRGKRAEEVGAEAAMGLVAAARAKARLDEHLGDMVSPLLSLAPAPSRIRVPRMTSHLETALSVAKLFTGCSYSAESDQAGTTVAIFPATS
jgi:RNA 3'-phosphate cyclase